MPARPTRTHRLSTDGGIGYALLEGYPRLSGSYDETTAVERLLIRSSQLSAFIKEAFPSPTITASGFVDIKPPRRLPNHKSLLASSWSAQPFLGDVPDDPLNSDPTASELTHGQLTEVTINYETQLVYLREAPVSGGILPSSYVPEQPETFCTRTISVGGEFQSFDPAKTKITQGSVTGQEGTAESNADKQQPIVKIIPSFDISVRQRINPDPNWQTMVTILGTVNQFTDKLFYDLPVETVLFMGFEARPRYVWLGETNAEPDRLELWDIDYRFAGRHIKDKDSSGTLRDYGWNHVWSPNKQEWVRVKRGPQDEPLYRLNDLAANLFIANVT